MASETITDSFLNESILMERGGVMTIAHSSLLLSLMAVSKIESRQNILRLVFALSFSIV
jgi:hypothetical protein